MQRIALLIVGLLWLWGCQTVPSTSLYDELGGMPVIEKIVDNYIDEISYDRLLAPHFMDSNIERVRSKLIEQICNLSNGPCQYTGDTMIEVHVSMQINEGEFTRSVELMINALTRAGVPYRTRNKLLAKLAPLRSEIIYR